MITEKLFDNSIKGSMIFELISKEIVILKARCQFKYKNDMAYIKEARHIVKLSEIRLKYMYCQMESF